MKHDYQMKCPNLTQLLSS